MLLVSSGGDLAECTVTQVVIHMVVSIQIKADDSVDWLNKAKLVHDHVQTVTAECGSIRNSINSWFCIRICMVVALPGTRPLRDLMWCLVNMSCSVAN